VLEQKMSYKKTKNMLETQYQHDNINTESEF